MARASAWAVSGLLLGVPLLAQGASAQPPLRVTGSVSDLRAGAAGSLALTVANDGDADVVVTSLSARVTSATAGCPLSALSMRAWSGRLVVPAGGEAGQVLSVRVGSEPGCANATWQLAYTAS